MSKSLQDDHDNDDAKHVSTPRLFFPENSRAKKPGAQD